MLTGIIGAMAVETAAIKDILTDRAVENYGGIEFVRGKLGKNDVVVATCGIGKVFAAICAQTMILKYAPDRIINTGVAGSLSKSVGLLDVVISTSVVQHDMDTSPLGDPVGLISGINIVDLPASPSLIDLVSSTAERVGIRSVKGVIASGDQFIADEGKKAYIRDTFGAIACEMEGASIGQVCYVNNVPFAVMRTISDGKGEALDYMTFAVSAAEKSISVIEKFLKNY